VYIIQRHPCFDVNFYHLAGREKHRHAIMKNNRNTINEYTPAVIKTPATVNDAQRGLGLAAINWELQKLPKRRNMIAATIDNPEATAGITVQMQLRNE
jgi:hypothetical protein